MRFRATETGNRGDIAAGLFLTLAAVVVLLAILEHPLGSLNRPGPGAFPFVLALLLAVLGVAVLARGWRAPSREIGAVAWRALTAVTAGFILFPLAIEVLGFMAAVVVLVITVAAAEANASWKTTVIVAATLAGVSSIIFLGLLRLPIALVTW